MPLEWLPAGVAVCAIGAMLWLEHRYARRDARLRRTLGACRTALGRAEADRDRAEAERDRAGAERDRLTAEIQAQGAELARYRRQHAPHDRLTRQYLPAFPLE